MQSASHSANLPVRPNLSQGQMAHGVTPPKLQAHSVAGAQVWPEAFSEILSCILTSVFLKRDFLLY